jgi:hypothetical protein
MDAVTAVEDVDAVPGECWCCGMSAAPETMVHLGNHPEVAICVRCAYSIKNWAWEIEDRSRTGPAVRARDGFRRLRRGVVRLGWHQSRLVGRPLRWLGRRLP